MSKKYSIGEVSVSCNIPIKTLRYYDEIDLLKPEHRSAESNYRYYSKRQMTTLLIIRRLRRLGFCLQDIRSMIADSDLQSIEDKMKERIDAITEEINSLHVKKKVCEDIMQRLQYGINVFANSCGYVGDDSLYGIKTEEIPKGRMLYSREIMKSYHNAGVSLHRWIEIYEKCTEFKISTKSSVIITYHDKPLDQFLMKDCDVEFGVILADDAEIPDHVTNVRVWGGLKAVTAYHLGNYAEIMKTHVSMLRWIHQSEYELSGPVSEEFVITPLDIDNDDAHLTKIIMPVVKRSH